MNDEKKPFDSRAFLAFGVLLALVLLLPVYWEFIGYTPAKRTPSPLSDSTATASAPPVASVPSQQTAQDSIVKAAVDTASGLFVRDAAWSEGNVRVTTPNYEAVFSTAGARLLRFTLKNYEYTDRARHGVPIVLFDAVERDSGALGPHFQFADPTVDLAHAPFTADRNEIILGSADSASIRFTAKTRTGDDWALNYTFFGDRHDFRTRLIIPSPGKDGIERELHYGWLGGLAPTEPDPKSDNNDFAAVALMGEDIERIKNVDHEHVVTNMAGTTHWAAVRTKYFVCATIPVTDDADGFRAEAHDQPYVYNGKPFRLKRFSALVRIPLRVQTPIDQSFTVYLGPIDYDVLKRYDVGLEQMVDLGWRWIVRPFALVLLWLFQKLYALFANYGIVIIVFSLLIKSAFHPLTKKQVRSMRAMQALAPRMEKLRERHKGDPTKLNAEMMKLYREAGINPLSGCLPLLPQLPIFYALFQVFRTSIELRGAHFAGWITDLSQKDPYYILPILMTASMFVQQKLSTKDPKQKMLTYMMPLIFGFMFKDFPAGLTLYWTMFNLFSVIEQVWLIGHPTETDLETGKVGSGRVVKTEVGR